MNLSDAMKNGDPDEIVGHKTFSDGPLSFRHEPLTRREAAQIRDVAEGEKEKRAITMPDEQSAIDALFEAYQRLRELGWREAIYCPKDGSIFQVIEAGSTGIHNCSYSGEWPTGTWFVHHTGDLWPSRPILFRAGEGGGQDEAE
jgi:hypothetical protein